MKPPFALLAAMAALAACTSQPEQSVANQFRQTEEAIENRAAALEAETANATRSATNALEREAAAFENRVDANEIVPGNKIANSQ